MLIVLVNSMLLVPPPLLISIPEPTPRLNVDFYLDCLEPSFDFILCCKVLVELLITPAHQVPSSEP